MKPVRTMFLSLWKELFNDTILARGADYCCKNVVQNVIRTEQSIEADVVGTETYHVRINIELGAVDEMTCTCPYAEDGTRACKHMAAVLFSVVSPDDAKTFKPAKKPSARKLPPPKPNCTLVTVKLEDEDTTAQRYCAIPEVKVGDYVAFILNEREVVGLVETVEQMPRPIDAYALNRKSHILKITEKPEKVSPYSIRILPPAPLYRLTLACPNEIRYMKIKRERIDKHHIKAGDTLLLDWTEVEEAVILAIDDLVTDDLPYCKFFSARENAAFAEILRNKAMLHTPDGEGAVVEFVLHNWITDTEEAIIPAGVDRIAAFAFEDNWDVQRAVITGAFVHLDSFAFAHNESIEEISIQNDRVYCNVSSFEGCEGLKKLILPYTLYYMKDELSDKLPWVEISFTLNDNVNVNGIIYSADMTKVICCTNRDIVIYYSPATVTTIYPHAFSNCTNLKRFLLKPCVTERGRGCLENCFALEEVAVSFDDDIEVVLMFGTKYAPGARSIPLQRKDGEEIVFYLPPKCKFTQLPQLKKALHETKPEDIDSDSAYAMGEHYENVHFMKEAVVCYIRAAKAGHAKAHEKLIKLAQNEYHREHFDLVTFDEVMRTRSIAPALYHFGLTDTGKAWAGVGEEQLLERLQDTDTLCTFLIDLAKADILHTSLLNTLLKRLYPQFGKKASHSIKALFYRCARKISKDDCTLTWREALLEELQSMPEYQKEFLFDRLDTFYLKQNPEHEQLILSIGDEELRSDVMRAYQAAVNPQNSNVDLCQVFLNKAAETNDEIYQWCALMAVSTYIAQCWRNKNYVLLRSILQIAIDACNNGMYLMGIPILHYRQNLKRNIPRSFYRKIAQKLHVRGLLSFNDYENLLGDYRMKYIDFFFRYADYFDLEKPDNVMMTYIRDSWFCIPGIEIKDEETKDAVEKIPYEAFVPLKTGDDLVLFSSPHEAVSYMVANNLPVADYYFNIPYARILSIMDAMQVDEAKLMPLYLGKVLPKEYVERSLRLQKT